MQPCQAVPSTSPRIRHGRPLIPARETEPSGPPLPIHVESEWAPLRECVYGWSGEFIWPRFLQDAELRPSGEVRQLWQQHAECDVARTSPAYFERWQSQVEGAADFLRSAGVIVHQPQAHSPMNLRFPRGQHHGSLTGWMRDPFVTIGPNVIELAPRSLFHRRQRFPIRSILAGTMDRGARYFAQPDAGADDSRDEPGWGYLEGGDLFVLGRTVLVGHSGHCSNPEGARWLQHVLGDDYQVIVVPLSDTFQHLDCALCTPREGVLILCPEAFPQGLPACLADWDRIEVSVSAARDDLATNHLVLDDRTIVVPSEAAHDAVARALAQRRFDVVRLPYGAVYRVGGSFRCAYQPLVRR